MLQFFRAFKEIVLIIFLTILRDKTGVGEDKQKRRWFSTYWSFCRIIFNWQFHFFRRCGFDFEKKKMVNLIALFFTYSMIEIKLLNFPLTARTSEIVDIRQMPTSCEDLNRMGHEINGFFLIKGSKKMETVYCDYQKGTPCSF
jgi:hypothetical protein